MMTDDQMSMITESTFDSHMRRTMERLEEKLHSGEREVSLDIHEFLHILSRMVSLEQERDRMAQMLFRTFKGYSDHFNLTPAQPLATQAPQPTKE